MKKLLGLAVLALGVVLAGAPNVMADDTFCTFPLPPGAVDNLIVDGFCLLDVANPVEGNVEVLLGGTLSAFGASIGGNIEVEPGGTLDIILDSTVGGNIECKGALGCTVFGTMVEGNLQGEKSTGVVAFLSNFVFGNVEVKGNLDGVTIQVNTIDGNLECKGNNPSSLLVCGNFIAGKDECGNQSPCPPPPVTP